MSKDNRDILGLLRNELDFIEKGGYGRPVRTPWHAKSAFQDSLVCINYAYQYRAHHCSECHLLDFVPAEGQSADIPCHQIPLTEQGQTIEQLEGQDDQPRLEAAVKRWLREKNC